MTKLDIKEKEMEIYIQAYTYANMLLDYTSINDYSGIKNKVIDIVDSACNDAFCDRNK